AALTRGGLAPRITRARPDLAAKEVGGGVEVPRFVEGTGYEIAAAQTAVRKTPAPEAELQTEALKGEQVTIYDRGRDGWAWGQLADDGYVGYIAASALGPPGP